MIQAHFSIKTASSLFALSGLVLFAHAPYKAYAQNENEKISAEIATVLSNTGTQLSFRLFNKSDSVLKALTLGTLINRIVVTYPDGEIKEVGVPICAPIDPELIAEIKPNSSFTWKIDLSKKMGLYEFFHERPGTYKVGWKIKGLNFDEVTAKNEVLITNEK